MAYNPQPSYIPHPDFDPSYATYPTQPFPQQQPPYPSYPPPQPVPFSQPHQNPEAQAQRSHHVPQQQYQLPNQAHGHGPPGSMPPPSSIPDSSFHRQNYAYASAPRTPDRWPLGVTDDQRQLQEHFRQQSQAPQIHPSYHQPPPITSAPPAGPVSSFPPPSKTRSPSQGHVPPQSPQVFPTPPTTSQQSQQSMTATAANPVSQPTLTSSIPPTEPAKNTSSSTTSPSLESQRVSALLDLNRVLLQEVVALQNAKSKATPSQPQQPSQKTSPSPAADANATTAPQSTPDAAPSNKQEGDNTKPEESRDASATTNETGQTTLQQPNQASQPSQQTPNSKIVATKEYIEYMRRLQANLAYLASVADRHHKPGNAVPQFPAIMEAPNLPPAKDKGMETAEGEGQKGGGNDLKEIYSRLRELWPEYKGKTTVATGATPGTQGPNVPNVSNAAVSTATTTAAAA
ncbi:MAG: hypothetical protein Q9181_001495 [Wetmoreana brouardii]